MNATVAPTRPKTPAAETATGRLRVVVQGSADAGPHLERFAAGLNALRSYDLPGYEKAVIEFRQATDAAPLFAPAWAGLAEAYSCWAFRVEIVGEEARGLYELSHECADRALRLAPERSESHRAMAMAMRRGPKADDTARREEALTALDLDPNDPLNWWEYWRAAGYPLPDGAIDRCLELDPRLCGARIDLGAALYARERYHEAAREFALALQASPRNSLASYDLAMTLARIGHAEKGRAVLADAVAAHPTDALLGRGAAALGAARA